MPRKIVETSQAPSPLGPYSQAVQAGPLLFVSGQIPLDPDTGDVVSGDIAEQTRRVLHNLSAVLRASGYGWEDVVKTTIFLRDMADFPRVNEVYGEVFSGDSAPARSTVQVARLPKDVGVEIECIAYR